MIGLSKIKMYKIEWYLDHMSSEQLRHVKTRIEKKIADKEQKKLEVQNGS